MTYQIISCLLFVDDCVLYRNIHSLQDCLILQEDLDSLSLWEVDWQVKFKSCQMSLYESDLTLFTQTNSSRLYAAPAKFGKHSVRKYLGRTITENMDWGQHISDTHPNVESG